jgi:hypothetical protein
MSKVVDTVPKRSGPGAGLAQHAAREVLDEARSADTHCVTALDVIRFLAVSAYFSLVFLVLVVAGKVRPGNPLKGFPRWLIYQLFYRVKQPRVLTDFAPESGHCYLAKVPPRILSDYESASRIQVYENGVPLAQPHADHTTIRQRGHGAFSHWAGAIYFSTSDNSDPRSNGRTYTYKEV